MIKRREFLKTSVAAGAGLLVLKSGTRLGAQAPSNKLNIGMVGTWGRADAHFGVLQHENIVALCDINDDHLAHAAKKFPNAKTYTDWRKMFDQKDMDAVVCCSTDFTHAFVANWALNRDMHIYSEKPLGVTVEEVRTVRATYEKKRKKCATQIGTQRHAMDNFNRCRELVRDGAIGELKEAFAWGNRQVKPAGCEYDEKQGLIFFKEKDGSRRTAGYLPDAGEPPANLHYDLWIGPSQYHPYNPGYFAKGPGANCLSWNMFWDFGGGQIGDMGSHTMDLGWCPLDADLPTTAEAKGDPVNDDITPIKCEFHFDIPANDWRGPIRVSWYQGGVMPQSPRDYIDLNKIGHGAMWKGDKGFIVADFNSRMIIPFGKEPDLTYYKPRTKETLIPPLGGFQDEWINAAKGNPEKTTCNFDYGGKMIEMMNLGLVAYRAGKKVKYDGKTGLTDDATANSYLKKKYRDGWTLNG